MRSLYIETPVACSNCFCAALLLGLTAYDAECLKTVFGDLSGKEYKQHRQIRRILRAGVKAAMVRDTEDDMQDGLLRMLASLQDGATIWDDVCFLVSQMVGMNINVLSAVDSVDVIQVAHYSPGMQNNHMSALAC